jgi:DNA polymerase I-like protein with 3'-5' exonuclease and polymerase domains
VIDFGNFDLGLADEKQQKQLGKPHSLSNMRMNLSADGVPVIGQRLGVVRPDLDVRVGRAFVIGDYGQLEFRLAACASGDPNMIACCKAEDAHKMMADRISATEYMLSIGERFPRPQAKTANFAQIYGAGANRVKEKVYKDLGILWPDEFAETVVRETHAMYARLYQFSEEVHTFIRANGWIANVLGHRRDLPQVWNMKDRGVSEAALREGFNHVIQSLGHDLLSLAINWFLEVVRVQGLDWWLVNDNHDGVMIIAPAAEARRCAWLMKTLMERAPEMLLGARGMVAPGWLKGVPIPAEMQVGTHYGALTTLSDAELEPMDLVS